MEYQRLESKCFSCHGRNQSQRGPKKHRSLNLLPLPQVEGGGRATFASLNPWLLIFLHPSLSLCVCQTSRQNTLHRVSQIRVHIMKSTRWDFQFTQPCFFFLQRSVAVTSLSIHSASSLRTRRCSSQRQHHLLLFFPLHLIILSRLILYCQPRKNLGKSGDWEGERRERERKKEIFFSHSYFYL